MQVEMDVWITKYEVCRSGGYGIVVSHSPIYDSA